jgi:hypothetical protein
MVAQNDGGTRYEKSQKSAPPRAELKQFISHGCTSLVKYVVSKISRLDDRPAARFPWYAFCWRWTSSFPVILVAWSC